MMKLIYPIIFCLIFLSSFYVFKVVVAKERLKKMDIEIEFYNYFQFLLPIITVYLIYKLQEKKKDGELNSDINIKRLFFSFNTVMDIVSLLTLVLIEKGELVPNKTRNRAFLAK